MTITLQKADNNGAVFSTVTMEQKYAGGKVTIVCKTQFPWEHRVSRDIIKVDKDDANSFYAKRIKDGYKRV